MCKRGKNRFLNKKKGEKAGQNRIKFGRTGRTKIIKKWPE